MTKEGENDAQATDRNDLRRSTAVHGDRSGPVGQGVLVQSVPGVLREVDPGIAAALDVVHRARLEREWE
jgi:hypothetical protein